MSVRQLLIHNLAYYWRTNLAVLCGVIAATAVIGGALVVGDSVRDSLRQMTLDRLGQIDFALQGNNFFREELATELSKTGDVTHKAAPALMMQGTVETESENGPVQRAGQINVFGLDQRLWNLLDRHDLQPPGDGEIVLNERVAQQLNVSQGQQISLVVEIPSSIPRDSLLGERNETTSALLLNVSAITPDDWGVSRLGLNPTQQLPANVYVSLSQLQSQIGLAAVPRSRTNPFAKPARVNSLFFASEAGSYVHPADEAVAKKQAESLTQQVGQNMTLADLSLRLAPNSKHGYLSLESEQMMLSNAISDAATQAAADLDVHADPVLVYLVNELRNANNADAYSMYSVAAGIDPDGTAPFGPFEFQGDHQALQGNQIWINDWLAEDLQVKPGDAVDVKYYVVGDRGELPEEEKSFIVGGIVGLSGPAADPGFTPTVPGVTDADSYADWREPFPLKRDKITPRDDAYWEQHRTTPKLFLPLATAQDLWKSRYGNLTSVRLAPKPDQSLDELAKAYAPVLLHNLNLPGLGFAVQPVKMQGLLAAQGTTDFTGLFTGFSFFLILSAAILIGLLFRLGVEQRVRELGLLSAVGLSPNQVRNLLLGEGALLVLVGGLIGIAAEIGYAALMIHGLKTWWIGAIGTRFLFLSLHWQSVLLGFVISACVAGVSVGWALWQTRKFSTRQLLLGDAGTLSSSKPARWAKWVALVLLSGSALLLVLTLLKVIPEQEAFGGFSWKVVSFFLVGVGLLIGGLGLLGTILASRSAVPIQATQASADARLAFRNASRNRLRSVLTASLIASATFVIVAVGAGQMNPTSGAPRARSGNGGFTLVAETSIPILYDLNTSDGRAKAGIRADSPEQTQLLEDARFFSFRMKPGENASCLNLYQTQVPTILGVPEDVLNQLIKEDRFLFADTPGEHPWALLRKKLPGNNVPALGDLNTLQYSLHKSMGETIAVPNEESPRAHLQIAGMFANSVFQGVLVVSESNFQKLFPEEAGFRYYLIEVEPTRAQPLTALLESQLGDSGFDAESVDQRLADFLSVQNTYLSTFQTLGGLGLLLGTLGLATVMVRNVLERRKEFALLQAVGFGRVQMAWLVIWENAILLGSGLLIGIASALLAMSPHLTSSVSNTPWLGLFGLLCAVFVVGMVASLVAVRAALKTPILEMLRGE